MWVIFFQTDGNDQKRKEENENSKQATLEHNKSSAQKRKESNQAKKESKLDEKKSSAQKRKESNQATKEENVQNRNLTGNRDKDGNLISSFKKLDNQGKAIVAGAGAGTVLFGTAAYQALKEVLGRNPTAEEQIEAGIDKEDVVEENVVVEKQIATPSKPPKGHPESNISDTMPEEEVTKPGYKLAKGGGFWSVDTKSPYWQTDEGAEEALQLYGRYPAWVKKPEEEDDFVSFKELLGG